MKYIFELYWFNHGGDGRNGITAADYQTTPPGGWNNWTAQHNVDYMAQMVVNGEHFILLGDLRTLRGQARNAGQANTRCMVGAEVLLLLSAGYACTGPNIGDGPDVILRFTHPGGNVTVDPQLAADAALHLNDKATSHHFWTVQRKALYRLTLQ
ncbi:MAG: hypothetical protein ABJD97_02785 [Betaproteobacteria bacterium]